MFPLPSCALALHLSSCPLSLPISVISAHLAPCHALRPRSRTGSRGSGEIDTPLELVSCLALSFRRSVGRIWTCFAVLFHAVCALLVCFRLSVSLLSSFVACRAPIADPGPCVRRSAPLSSTQASPSRVRGSNCSLCRAHSRPKKGLSVRHAAICGSCAALAFLGPSPRPRRSPGLGVGGHAAPAGIKDGRGRAGAPHQSSPRTAASRRKHGGQRKRTKAKKGDSSSRATNTRPFSESSCHQRTV